jgi:hypothetical protein
MGPSELRPIQDLVPKIRKRTSCRFERDAFLAFTPRPRGGPRTPSAARYRGVTIPGNSIESGQLTAPDTARPGIEVRDIGLAGTEPAGTGFASKEWNSACWERRD